MSEQQRNLHGGAAALRRWCPGLLLALAGCAAAGQGAAMQATAAPPASPEEARAEVEDLERQIARGRLALGLPAHGREDSALDAMPEAAPGPPPEPSAPAAEEAPAAREAFAPRAKAEPDPCRHTRAICHAARRICHLADYLADDDARQRCVRARRDCDEARRITDC